MTSSEDKQSGIYVASRVSRADVWKNLRDNMGVSITSSWIDEAGEGDTEDFGELWTRITREIAASTGLVFYGHTADQPWKGALVEVGIALALGKPVAALILGELEGRTMRPVGSWLHHPLVRRFTYMEDAIEYAQSGAPQSSCVAPLPLPNTTDEERVRDIAQRMIGRWNGPGEMLVAYLRLLLTRPESGAINTEGKQ